MCCSVGPSLSRIGRLFSAAEKSYAALRFHSPVRCSGLRQRGNRFVAEARVSVLVAEVPGGVLRSQRVEAVLAAIEQVVQHQGLTNVLHFQRCQMRQPVAAFFGFDRPLQLRVLLDKVCVLRNEFFAEAGEIASLEVNGMIRTVGPRLCWIRVDTVVAAHHFCEVTRRLGTAIL